VDPDASPLRFLLVRTVAVGRSGQPRLTSLRATLVVLTLSTIALGTLAAVVVICTARALRFDDLVALGLILGVPLTATHLGAQAARPSVTVSAAVALVALAAVGGGVAVGQFALNAVAGTCDLAPASCGLGLDSPLTTVLGAILAGGVPVLGYVVAARSLRDRPARLAASYLVSLPAFALWVGFLTLLARALAYSHGIPAD
jgi:hypothetical protein